jgi:hypothetical protein
VHNKMQSVSGHHQTHLGRGSEEKEADNTFVRLAITSIYTYNVGAIHARMRHLHA